MEIGISTYLYHDADIFKGLERLSAIGYRFIEVEAQSLPDPLSGDRRRVAEIARCARSLGLEVRSIHLSKCPEDIGGRDVGLRRKGVEWIKSAIDLCRAFEPEYVGIHRGGLWEDLSEPKHFRDVQRWTTESVAEIAEYAKRMGMKFEIETSGGYCDVKAIKEIIALFPREEVGVLVDVGHCWRARGRDPIWAIREAGERLFGVHVHDNHRYEDEHLVPGEGTIDWIGVVQALRDVGYRGVFMLECFRSRRTQDKDTIALLAKRAAERLLSA